MSAGRQFSAGFRALVPANSASGNFQLDSRGLSLFQRRTNRHATKVGNQRTSCRIEDKGSSLQALKPVSVMGDGFVVATGCRLDFAVCGCTGGVAVRSGTEWMLADAIFVCAWQHVILHDRWRGHVSAGTDWSAMWSGAASAITSSLALARNCKRRWSCNSTSCGTLR